MVRIHSERFLNDDQLDKAKLDVEQKQVNEWIAQISPIGSNLTTSCIEKTFIDKMKGVEDFFKLLQAHFGPRFPNSDSEFFKYSVWYSEVKKDIRRMREYVGNQQTMAFVKEFKVDVFRKPIVTRRQYKFIPRSKVIYDFSSYLIQRFDVFYPFNDNRFDASKPCLKAIELPLFFRDEKAR